MMSATEQLDVTLLVIEDNTALQAAIADLFVGDGYRVMQTWNGTDGHRLARQGRPHAVLLDLGLPGRPGVEVLRALKSDPQTADIPVVVMSGASDLLLSHEARLADAVVHKPFDLDDLLMAVERAVRSRVRPWASAAGSPAGHPSAAVAAQ